MKVFLSSLLLAFILTTHAQQINIPNAGFETWVAGTFFIPELPQGWKSSSVFPGIKKATDAHSGTYAMELSVAQYSTGVGSDNPGFAFSTSTSTVSPLYYTFWAKVHLAGTDKMNVTADLTNSGSTLLVTTIPYGHGQLTTSDNTAIWKQFSFTLQGSGPQPYDSVTLQFAFYPQLDTGTHVLVDDLAFSSYPAGILEANADATIENSYPNPATNMATIMYAIRETADVSLEVYDVLGQRMTTAVNEKQSNGKYRAEIDVASYPDGMYLARLTAHGKTYVQKITVHH